MSPVGMANYTEEFLKNYRKVIQRIRLDRKKYRTLLGAHLCRTYGKVGLWSNDFDLPDIVDVALLLSSPRGGSSITASILNQQAAGAAKNEKMLVGMPGETKPHLLLASLYFPLSNRLSDELEPYDAWRSDPFHPTIESAVSFLREEILCEVGYPLSQTHDLLGFAIRIYGRLLLQWPEADFGPAEIAIGNIFGCLERVVKANGTPGVYFDNKNYRRQLLTEISRVFEGINLRYYDGSSLGQDFSAIGPWEGGAPSDYQIEEAPFIVPKPWNHVALDEMKRAVLILKDTSDAWRIMFWREVFSKSRLRLFHLSRHPRETINGLCDGWNYPYGFQTIPAPFELHIPGYTDFGGWRKKTVNFSTCQEVWELLDSCQSVELEHIAAVQWVTAHSAILKHSDHTYYWRIGSSNSEAEFGFEFVRKDPIGAVTEICNVLGVSITDSIKKAAEYLPQEVLMALGRSKPEPDRWKRASNRTSIEETVNLSMVKSMANELGYTL